MNPASKKRANTTMTVPGPLNHIPYALALSRLRTIPPSTANTPVRKIPSTTGMAKRLCRYL